MDDVREATFGSDKESRSVDQSADAAKPDTGSSEDRQHENPCHEPTQLCGHPVSAVVSSDEGTAYCAMCEQEPTCGIAGCDGKHHPQDHNAIIDAPHRTTCARCSTGAMSTDLNGDGLCAACNEPAKGDATINGERYCHEGESPTCYEKASWFGDDASRSLFHSLQDVIRERDALRAKVDGLQAHLDSIPYESEVELVRVIRDLRAEVERVKAERNTIHDWYVDAKTENVALRAEVERMRPVVEAACDYMDTVGRYDTTGIHRTGKGSRARIRQCVDAYRKDTNDE